MKISSLLKFLISLCLAAGLFYLFFSQVSLDELTEKLDHVNYWWVVLSIILSLLSHWLRAYRWNLMLSPKGYKLSSARTFVAVMIGYLANLAFPRLGEVSRCGILKKKESIPMSLSLGSVISERFIDLIVLLSLVVLDFIVEFDKVFDFFMEVTGWKLSLENEYMIPVALVIIIGSIILFMFASKKLLSYQFKSPTLIKLRSKIGTLIEGLKSIKNVQSIWGFIFSTIGIWLFYFLMSYVIFFSIEETSYLGFGAGLSILAAAGVAMSVPVQGGIGAYHFLVSGVLVLYGIGDVTSTFFATLLHSSQFISIVIVGGICAIISVFMKKNNPLLEGVNS